MEKKHNKRGEEFNIRKKKRKNGSGLNQLLNLYCFLKPFRWKFVLGMIFLLISNLASLMFPKFLGNMIDLGNQGKIREIGHTGLILLVIILVQALFSYSCMRLFVEITEKTLASIRQHLYNHLIKLPMSFFAENRVGELNSRISSDISLLQDSLTFTLADLISQLFLIVGGITLMMISSFKLTLFILTILPAVTICAFFYGRSIRSYSNKAQSCVAESNTIVEETLQGIQNVKAFTKEIFEIKRYKEKTNEIAKAGMRVGKYQAAMSFIIMAFFIGMGAVIWRGATLIALGQIEAGQLFSFVIYSGFIAGNIVGLASAFSRIQKSIGATEKLFLLLEQAAEAVDEDYVHDPADTLKGQIIFDHITFKYPSRKENTVIHDLSFVIEPGQQVALVGPSGAGKSTIAMLLLKFYEPTSGNLLFDNRNSHDFHITALRSQMAIVPQDVFLFGGTIRENIAYGKKDSGEEEIILAARKANAWDFIQSFPGKLNTIVGERGVQLSGGQRQRIAIARAVLKDPKILILDEATSSLDSESERLVQDALDKLMKGRTSIVIAHRLATIRNADKIIVLENGFIMEQGTHDELLNNYGLYKMLIELQTMM